MWMRITSPYWIWPLHESYLHLICIAIALRNRFVCLEQFVGQAMADSRVKALLDNIREMIVDNVSNDQIKRAVHMIYGTRADSATPLDLSPLITDKHFITRLFLVFFELFVRKDQTSSQWSVNGPELSRRCPLLAMFVHNYREYQLNLILILCELKVFYYQISEDIFDQVLRIFHSYDVLTDDRVQPLVPMQGRLWPTFAKHTKLLPNARMESWGQRRLLLWNTMILTIELWNHRNKLWHKTYQIITNSFYLFIVISRKY